MKYAKVSLLPAIGSLLLVSSCMSSTGKNDSRDSLTRESSNSGGDMYYE